MRPARPRWLSSMTDSDHSEFNQHSGSRVPELRLTFQVLRRLFKGFTMLKTTRKNDYSVWKQKNRRFYRQTSTRTDQRKQTPRHRRRAERRRLCSQSQLKGVTNLNRFAVKLVSREDMSLKPHPKPIILQEIHQSDN